MDQRTFEALQRIRSLFWEAEYEMTINRDDLTFMNSEDLRYLKATLRDTARCITDHIHAEHGWSYTREVPFSFARLHDR